jgi:hypothetical protein
VRLESFCAFDLAYTGEFHYVSPFADESGLGWGIGTGTATGERLVGTVQWSNHPRGRSDGVMLPSARGVVTTTEGAEVMFELTGRTVFVTQGSETVGRQLLMTLFESEDDRYRWLNDTVCMTEGSIDPVAKVMHMEVAICRPETA